MTAPARPDRGQTGIQAKKKPLKTQCFQGFLVALHPNFDTRDDCSKRVQLGGANRVQQLRLLSIGFPGKNRGMHPHRVQLLHAEVSVHPHRVQMHPGLVHFGDYDRASFVLTSQRYSFYRCKTEGAISAPFADVKSLVLIDPCVAGPDGSVRTL